MHRFIQKTGYLWLTLALCIILLLCSFWSLSIGSVKLPMDTIYKTIFNQISSPLSFTQSQSVEHDIVWLLRLPRIILAILVGIGLAISGVVMQAIVKNPLADPYILGISSGASFGATLAILLGIGAFLGNNYVGIAAFLGAFAISVGVLFIANIGGRANSVKLLLGGLALSSVCSAFSSFIVYFANDKDGIQNVVFWLMGSLAGAKWEYLTILTPIIFLGTLYLWSQYRMLNLMLLGDDVAITLGTDLHRYRQVYLLVSSMMIGFIVFASGIIGFVGLLIPHMVRMIAGTDHKKLIPLSAVVGAIFLVIADGISRIIIPNAELPIGILISLIGAPVFVYLLVKRTYGFGDS